MSRHSEISTPQAATLPQMRKHILLLKEMGFQSVEIRYDRFRCPYIIGLGENTSFDELGDAIDAA